MVEAPNAVIKPALRVIPNALDGLPLAATPQPLTTLVGRDQAVAAVLSQLGRPEVRLLTLTGPGGIGKTRLALQVAHQAGDLFSDGVVFVALAPLSEPKLVLPTIAQAIGITGSHSIERRLARALDRKPVLVVLDNFEQVVSAAGPLADLLMTTREVRFLVTSRVPLHISGEHEFAVAPLELPGPGTTSDLTRFSACALFEARTKAVRSDFVVDASNEATVLEICRLLGGVPLAIELAAARVKMLDPSALLEQLGQDLDLLSGGPVDKPPRHRTMRAAIQWSYDLLSSEQQRLFRELSLFVGGSSLAAMQAVSSPAGASRFLDDLAALIDASLLVHGRGADGASRYGMLDLIRRFAEEQLDASSELDATVLRLSQWLTELAEQAAAAFVGAGPGDWPALLEREVATFRATLSQLERAGNTAALLRLATALSPMWSALGHQREGVQWLTRALDRNDPATPPALELRARVLATRLTTAAGSFDRAETLAAGAAALAEQIGDEAGRADATCALGNLARGVGDQAMARAHYERALAIYRVLGDRYNTGYTLIQLAKLGDLGTPDRPGNPADIAVAEAMCREALAIYRMLDNHWGMARATNHISYLHLKAERFSESAGLAAEALELFAGSGNLAEGSQCIENLADAAGALGEAELGARLYGMAEGLQERLGTPMWPTYRAEYEQEVDRVRAQLDPATLHANWRAGRALSEDAMVADALDAARRLSQSRPFPASGKRHAHGLTARELDVLQMLATGASNQEIADALYISVTTVKGHVQSIMRKLGLGSRTALATFAVRMQLTEGGPEEATTRA